MTREGKGKSTDLACGFTTSKAQGLEKSLGGRGRHFQTASGAAFNPVRRSVRTEERAGYFILTGSFSTEKVLQQEIERTKIFLK